MPVVDFDKTKRLLTSAQYKSVFDDARYKVAHKHYLILARKTPVGHARLGLVVAKKNIRLASRRNRVKRVVRETFRHNQNHLDSLDIIFLARKGFDTLLPSLQVSAMNDAWRRLNRYSAREE